MKRLSYLVDLVVGGFGLTTLVLLVIVLHGCGTSRTSDVPAAAEATRIRAEVPPATAEVADLDKQRRAAELAAAKAKADNDTAESYKQAVLSEELGRLEGQAQTRQAQQQKALDAMADAADQRAVAERKEIADEKEAADAAADKRTWNWLGGIVVAAGVFIGIALSWLISPKLGAPLGVAAVATGLAMSAYGQTSPWLGIVGAVLVVGGAIAWLWGHRAFTGFIADAKTAVKDVNAEKDHLVSKLTDLHDAVAGIGTTTIDDALRGAATALGKPVPAGVVSFIKTVDPQSVAPVPAPPVPLPTPVSKTAPA